MDATTHSHQPGTKPGATHLESRSEVKRGSHQCEIEKVSQINMNATAYSHKHGATNPGSQYEVKRGSHRLEVERQVTNPEKPKDNNPPGPDSDRKTSTTTKLFPEWNIWRSDSQKAAEELAYRQYLIRLELFRSPAMKDFRNFQTRHDRGIAAMGIEKSPFIPHNAVQLKQHETAMENAEIKKKLRAKVLKRKEEAVASMEGWISASDAQELEAWGLAQPAVPKVGEIFGGRTMNYEGAAVHGGNRTVWSSAEWGAADESRSAPNLSWPSQLEFAQEGNGRMGRWASGQPLPDPVSYGRFLPVPRNDVVDPRLEQVTWNGVGEIPYQEKQFATIHLMDQVTYAPKDEAETYDRFEFSAEEEEQVKFYLGTELWNEIELAGVRGA